MVGTGKTLTVADVIEINRRMISRFGGIFFEGDDNLLHVPSPKHPSAPHGGQNEKNRLLTDGPFACILRARTDGSSANAHVHRHRDKDRGNLHTDNHPPAFGNATTTHCAGPFDPNRTGQSPRVLAG
jgi:hypothetical protein